MLELEGILEIFPALCVCLQSHFSRVRLFVTPWTVAHQTLVFTGFSRQEYWSRLPCTAPGGLPNPGIELKSLALSCGFFTTSTIWEALFQPSLQLSKLGTQKDTALTVLGQCLGLEPRDLNSRFGSPSEKTSLVSVRGASEAPGNPLGSRGGMMSEESHTSASSRRLRALVPLLFYIYSFCIRFFFFCKLMYLF